MLAKVLALTDQEDYYAIGQHLYAEIPPIGRPRYHHASSTSYSVDVRELSRKYATLAFAMNENPLWLRRCISSGCTLGLEVSLLRLYDRHYSNHCHMISCTS